MIVVMVGLGLLAGCGGDDDTVAGDGDGAAAEPSDDGSAAPGGGELAGRTFLSTGASEGGVAKELVAGTRVQVTFHEDGRLTANAGCNTLAATPTVTADRIEVGDGLSTTEMGCDPALHEQDQWLADLFAAGPTYALDGENLTLTAGDASLDLVDREVADPDRPLEGTTWTLDGMVDGDAVSSVPGDIAATVTFDAGSVTVDGTGCNGGGGSYSLDEGARVVTVSALAWTRMACGEPATTVEAALTEVLDGALAYEIEAGTLTLSHPGGKGLTLRAG